MNFRLTAILFGILLVGTLVLLGLSFWDDSPRVGNVLFEDLAAAGVKAKDINTIEIEKVGEGARIVLIREGDKPWELREPVKARADSGAADRLASALLTAKPLATRDTQAPLPDLGLQPPSLRVTLRKGSEQSATLNLGKVTIGGDQAVVFVSTGAYPDRAMAIRRSDVESLFTDAAKKSQGEPAAHFAKSFTDWRSVNPLGLPGVINRITIRSHGHTLTLAKSKLQWIIEEPPLGPADEQGDLRPAPDRFTGVQPLLNAITGLQAVTTKDFIEHPQDLKTYGLDPDDPNRVTLQITTDLGHSQTVYLGKPVEGESNKIYAQAEGDTGIFKATAPNATGFATAAAEPQALRDRNLLDIDRSRIDGIEVTAQGQTVKLRRSPTGWELVEGPNDPRPALTEPVEALLAALTERRTVLDFPAADDARFAPNEVKAEVKLLTEGGSKAADAKDQKPIRLTFGKVEGDKIYVRRVTRDGSSRDLLLPITLPAGPNKGSVNLLEALTKSRLDYMDPKLPSFSPTVVKTLTFTRAGQETVEIRKLDHATDAQHPQGQWEFEQPPSWKGKPADGYHLDQVMVSLATAVAKKFVTEQPTEAQLVEWGLDAKAPKLKVVVSLGSSPSDTRTYYFGKDSSDDQVYARVEGKTEVFLVPKTLASWFSNAPDLRDRTLVTFDRNKLKGLKLRGWALADQPPMTLELDRKGAAWTARAPADLKVNSAKVEELVHTLHFGRVLEFVKPVEEKFGLDVEKQGALEVTLELEGASPIVVTIGGMAPGDKDVYVKSSQRPDEAMTLPAEPLRTFRTSRDALLLMEKSK